MAEKIKKNDRFEGVWELSKWEGLFWFIFWPFLPAIYFLSLKWCLFGVLWLVVQGLSIFCAASELEEKQKAAKG